SILDQTATHPSNNIFWLTDTSGLQWTAVDLTDIDAEITEKEPSYSTAS
ncbi:hypothetical protein PC116_g2112, partial [Phytophthora cactorum]